MSQLPGSYAVFSFPLSFETVSLLNSKTTEKQSGFYVDREHYWVYL
jgi:hypothetical protein